MRLVSSDDQDGFTIFVTKDEYRMLISGLGETMEALEDWEFHIRTGVTRDEMRALLHQLNEHYPTLD